MNNNKLSRAELAKLSRVELAKHFSEKYSSFTELAKNERKSRQAVMLKRHAYFSGLTNSCSSLKEFYNKYHELFQIWGVEFYWDELDRKLVARIWLDFNEHETYYFEEIDSRVVVSPIISWQNEVFANEDWDISIP